MLRDSDKKMLSARTEGWFLATLLTGHWFLSSHKKLAILSDERRFDYAATATSTWWLGPVGAPSGNGWQLWDASPVTAQGRGPALRSRLGNI